MDMNLSLYYLCSRLDYTFSGFKHSKTKINKHKTLLLLLLNMKLQHLKETINRLLYLIKFYQLVDLINKLIIIASTGST